MAQLHWTQKSENKEKLAKMLKNAQKARHGKKQHKTKGVPKRKYNKSSKTIIAVIEALTTKLGSWSLYMVDRYKETDPSIMEAARKLSLVLDHYKH